MPSSRASNTPGIPESVYSVVASGVEPSPFIFDAPVSEEYLEPKTCTPYSDEELRLIRDGSLWTRPGVDRVLMEEMLIEYGLQITSMQAVAEGERNALAIEEEYFEQT